MTSTSANTSLKIKLLSEDSRAPTRGSKHAAGYDLYSPQSMDVMPGTAKINMGLSMVIPQGYYGQLMSRSSMAKKGIVVIGGVIDSDYRGEVSVMLLNASSELYPICKGDRIAQLILIKVTNPPICVCDELDDDTERGTGGFGSTGK